MRGKVKELNSRSSSVKARERGRRRGGVVPAGFIEEVGCEEGVETIVCEARAIFD
jgi:hypothetical protein